MAIKGKLDDARTLRFREFLCDGEIGGVPYTVTKGAKTINIEMMGERVMYSIEDMIRDAHKKLEKRTAEERERS